MIPERFSKEWADLIEGKIDPKISSFSLQMKINSLRMEFKTGRVKINEAVTDLHTICIKYETLYSDDIQKIFKK